MDVPTPIFLFTMLKSVPLVRKTQIFVCMHKILSTNIIHKIVCNGIITCTLDIEVPRVSIKREVEIFKFVRKEISDISSSSC